uniref:Uncharacterized protein n=1 Tax=Anguilla anguilla TaxID=7936 RepID=A0A0E9VQH9_ANGAN
MYWLCTIHQSRPLPHPSPHQKEQKKTKQKTKPSSTKVISNGMLTNYFLEKEENYMLYFQL